MQNLKHICFSVLLSLSLLCSCSSQRTPSVVHFGISHIPSSLDPAETEDFVASKILANIFETLVQYEDGSLETQPALAESLRISPDGAVWTFYLRRNVAFHDATPFNAQAVKISFDRQINPQSDFYIGGKNVYGSSTLSMIDRIDIVDEFTVRFYLKYPHAPFNHNLATCFGSSIVSPTALKKFGPEFGRHPVGTGPFRFASWKDGEYVTITANEEYWGSPPKIDRVDFVVVPRAIDRVEKILDGSLEIIEDVGATLTDRLYLKDEIDLIFSKDLGVNVLGFNCQKEPFSDVRVRKAIAMAFNKEKFVHTMLRGRGSVADGPLPPALVGFSSDIERMGFDPGAAKELLAVAGYPEGFRVDLWCYYGSERLGVVPLAIQNDLKKIGVEVNIKYIDDWERYNVGIMKGEVPLFIDGWRGDPVDPDGFLYPIFHSRARTEGGNLFHYSNKRLDRLLEEARRTMNEKVRMKLYDEAQEIIVADLPCLFINYASEVFVSRSFVKGFSVNPLGVVRLDRVEYEPF